MMAHHIPNYSPCLRHHRAGERKYSPKIRTFGRWAQNASPDERVERRYSIVMFPDLVVSKPSYARMDPQGVREVTLAWWGTTWRPGNCHVTNTLSSHSTTRGEV